MGFIWKEMNSYDWHLWQMRHNLVSSFEPYLIHFAIKDVLPAGECLIPTHCAQPQSKPLVLINLIRINTPQYLNSWFTSSFRISLYSFTSRYSFLKQDMKSLLYLVVSCHQGKVINDSPKPQVNLLSKITQKQDSCLVFSGT